MGAWQENFEKQMTGSGNNIDSEGTVSDDAGAYLEKDPLTAQIIGAAIEVHRELGPGLLESAYEQCLCHELYRRKVDFSSQVPLPVIYKDIQLDCGYRLDIVVEKQLVIEVKAVDRFSPIHQAQLMTYLRLSGIRTGLLLNFNSLVLKDGIRRLTL